MKAQKAFLECRHERSSQAGRERAGKKRGKRLERQEKKTDWRATFKGSLCVTQLMGGGPGDITDITALAAEAGCCHNRN